MDKNKPKIPRAKDIDRLYKGEYVFETSDTDSLSKILSLKKGITFEKRGDSTLNVSVDRELKTKKLFANFKKTGHTLTISGEKYMPEESPINFLKSNESFDRGSTYSDTYHEKGTSFFDMKHARFIPIKYKCPDIIEFYSSYVDKAFTLREQGNFANIITPQTEANLYEANDTVFSDRPFTGTFQDFKNSTKKSLKAVINLKTNPPAFFGHTIEGLPRSSLHYYKNEKGTYRASELEPCAVGGTTCLSAVNGEFLVFLAPGVNNKQFTQRPFFGDKETNDKAFRDNNLEVTYLQQGDMLVFPSGMISEIYSLNPETTLLTQTVYNIFLLHLTNETYSTDEEEKEFMETFNMYFKECVKSSNITLEIFGESLNLDIAQIIKKELDNLSKLPATVNQDVKEIAKDRLKNKYKDCMNFLNSEFK
jgi:hypothetical protein